MRVCYFGGYQRDHPRNAVFLRGLRQKGVEVKECHSVHPVKLLRYPILAMQYFRGCLQADLVLVASACHNYVFLGWLLARLTHKPLIFDPLVSLYDTLVQDRELIPTGSIRARWYWLLDRVTCALADKVLLDTKLHAEYFSRTFGFPGKKFCAIPVGADDSVFFPRSASRAQGTGPVEVVYAGSFIPLHGVPCILEAAKLLENENFHFTLIGDGQTYAKSCQMAVSLHLRNVDFVGRLPCEMYAEYLARSDIVLGIFGKSEKTQRIIPCKVYDAAAMGKPVVTSNTPAIRAAFIDRENILLCEPDDSHSLADALRLVGNDAELRYRIACGAEVLSRQRFSSKMVGEVLLACFRDFGIGVP